MMALRRLSAHLAVRTLCLLVWVSALVGAVPAAAGSAHKTGPGTIQVVGLRAADHPALGQTPSAVTMQAEAGYGGNFRPAAWVPIRIRLTNKGPNFSGTLSISDDGRGSTSAVPANRVTYRRTIEMPQGGIKEVTLYVPGVDLGNALSVVLTAGTVGFIQQQVALNSLSNSTILVGVLAGSPATLTQLKSVAGQIGGEQLLTTPLDARRLDTQPLALANLDAIVMNNYNSGALSAAQRAALEDWVRAGGTLVTVGGPTAQATLEGLPNSLRLVQPDTPLTLQTVPSLSHLGGALAAGAVIAASGQLLQGSVVLGSLAAATAGAAGRAIGAPLVVEARLGMGTVLYSAIDPTLGPLAGWSGLAHFWSLLTAEARSGAATLTSAIAGTQPNGSRNDTLDNEIDNVSPPSTILFVILLGVYVVLLVPLNFVILQKLRKRDWSWVTLPALALLLVVATYGSAYFGRGRNVRTSVVSVVYLTSGSTRVVAQNYLGLFSPLAGDYTIKPDNADQLATSLFAGGGGGTSQGASSSLGLSTQQDQNSLTMQGMGMWSSRNAMFTGLTQYGTGLDGALRIESNGHLRGTLHNRSGLVWHSLVVLPYAGQPQAIGDLAPGQTARVDIATGNAATSGQSLGDFYGQSASLLPDEGAAAPNVALASLALRPDKMLGGALRLVADSNTIPTNPQESVSERFQHIIDQVFGSTSPAIFGQVMVLGWTAEPLVGFQVNGDRAGQQDTNLLVQTVPVELGQGNFVINANTLPARLAGSEQDLQQGYGNTGFSISSNSSAGFVARLPMPADGRHHLEVRSLTLSIASSGAGGALTSQSAALFDWTSGNWVTVDATSGQVDVRHPERFVNAAGVIRVRLNAQDSTLGINDPNTGVLFGATGVVR